MEENKTILQKKIEKDQRIMRCLKVSELRYTIAGTNLGPLDLQIRKDENKYTFLLDANPLEAEANEKMLKYFDLNG